VSCHRNPLIDEGIKAELANSWLFFLFALIGDASVPSGSVRYLASF
jgi:hypothetical protein